MKIIFFGIPDLGTICLDSLLQAGIKIEAVVPPIPTHHCHRIMAKFAEDRNIPVIHFQKKPNEQEFINSLKEIQPDLCLVCSFDHKFPKEVLEIPTLGFINCHPSLLPNYRGGNPYFHVIANGEKETGVTLHFMDANFDTGDIIVQTKVPIAKNDTIGTLFAKLAQESASLVTATISQIVNGEKIVKIAQPTNGSFMKAPNINIEKGENFIDWSKTAEEIENFIRACNPMYGAAAIYRGNMIKIWSANYQADSDSGHPPGTICYSAENGVGISTGKGVLFPLTLQLGFYMITDVFDFVSRTNPQIGESLDLKSLASNKNK